MTLFWIIAAALLTVALLFLLTPLLRKSAGNTAVSRDTLNAGICRDQMRELDADLAAGTVSRDRYQEAKGDIERRLIEACDAAGAAVEARALNRAQLAIGVGVLVPLLAAGLYYAVGNPGAIAPSNAAVAPHSVDVQQMIAMVDKLAERLKTEPEDAKGWSMLGRSYATLGRFADAVTAYQNAATRMPGNAQILADQADVLAMVHGGRLQGEPEKLVERALQLDPENVKALSLSGTVAFENKDYGRAITAWKKILALVPADSDFARSVTNSIDEARELGKVAGVPAPRAKVPEAPALPVVRAPNQGAARISGVVRLSPTLAARVSPGDTVFIFARPVEGSRMPLAILRKQAKELPITFLLDDTQAMSPATRLSSVTRVVVGARVSRNGDAKAQSGDFEGLSAQIPVGSRDITITIDSEVR